MALNDQQVAVLASKRLQMDGRSLLPLQSFIGNALNNLARECANDDYKRRYLMTVSSSALTATITNDSVSNYYADLSTIMGTTQIMLDYLQYGTIFYIPAQQTFTTSSVSGNRISITNHGYQTGLAIQITTTNTLPTPLALNTTYYVIRISANTFEVASSYANAVAGTRITLSDVGAGTQTVIPFQDYIAQWLASPTQGALISANPYYYPYIWLEQNLLYTNQQKGTFRFNVPYIPTLDNLPTALESDLIDSVVQIAVTQGFRPITPAQQ